MRFSGFLLPSSLLALLVSAQEGTVSVFDDPRIKSVRPCGQRCISSIAYAQQCPTSSALYNSCFCRLDLTSVATSTIEGCINIYCNNGQAADIALMVSIYTSYCKTVNADLPQSTPAGSASEPEADAETTTLATVTRTDESTVIRYTGTVTTEVPSSVTMVVIETFTTILNGESIQQFASEYQAAQNGSGGLEKGYQVAIGVGVVAIVIIILLLFMNKIRRRFFGYQGPHDGDVPVPQPPMGGIQGTGQEPRYR